MHKNLKLIVDQTKYDTKDFDFIRESLAPDTPKRLFIKGPFTEGDSRNKNERIYPFEMLREQIDLFNTNYISVGRATGELEHPQYPQMDANNAAHLIQNLHADGKVFIGKSKVLTTPKGTILEALINDGVQLGISSRSLGSVDENGIVSDLRLCTFDVVSDPSCQRAFVNGILESKNWICNNGDYEEAYENFEKKLDKIPTKSREIDAYLYEAVRDFIRKLK